MVPELERPRVTEIKVRMDCNGCVQKIKKALHGINGICSLYIDFPQQKITIIGWAEPEKIVKAIKKTRKVATICSHIEPTDIPAQQKEPEPEGEKHEVATEECKKPPAAEPPMPEAVEASEGPKEPLPSENQPPPEVKLSPPPPVDDTENQPAQPMKQKDVEEVHIIHHHPQDHGYRYGYPHRYSYGPNGSGFRSEPTPPPVYVTHSYNTYRPSPSVIEYSQSHAPYKPPSHASDYSQSYRYTYKPPPQGSEYSQSYTTYKPPSHASEYNQSYTPHKPPSHVSKHSGSNTPQKTSADASEYNHSNATYKPSPYMPEYEYMRSPSQYTAHYSRPLHYSEDYYNRNNGGGHVASIFSDENPNACRIV